MYPLISRGRTANSRDAPDYRQARRGGGQANLRNNFKPPSFRPITSANNCIYFPQLMGSKRRHSLYRWAQTDRCS